MVPLRLFVISLPLLFWLLCAARSPRPRITRCTIPPW